MPSSSQQGGGWAVSVRLVVRTTMEDNRQRVSLVLAKGQVWKTERGFIAIDHVGKRIIEYRFLTQSGQRFARSKMDSIDKVIAFLKANAGRLVEEA